MGGGGKGQTDTSSDLSMIAKDFYKDTSPVRRELTNQFLEALTTGGVGARIPIIRRSEEASKRATSNSLQALDAQLAQSGLSGTPFGTMVRTEAEQQGRFQTGQIAPNIVMQMLSQIPGYVTGSNQVVVSGLGQAAGAEASQASAQAQWLQAMMSPFTFGFGGG